MFGLIARPPRRRRDRGVTMVVFAVVAPMLIGAVGLSVDSGNLVLQRANVQKASDSAALAIAQDCARASRTGATAAQKQRCTPTGAAATAQLMVNGNAAGATASVPSSLTPAQGRLTMSVSKSVSMTFAGSVGAGPRTVTGSTTVSWGDVPTAATTFPLGMALCDFKAWEASPNSTPTLYRYDFYQSGRSDTGDNTAVQCGGKYSLKGALWLVDGTAWIPNSGCNISTSIGLTGWIAASNVLFPASCTQRAQNLQVGKTYLLPIYETPAASKYTNRFFPKIRGYAPFVMTGWRIGGFLGIFGIVNGGSVESTCTGFLGLGTCRGIKGYFTGSIIQLDEVDTYGVDPDGDFGSVRIKITS